MARAKTFEPDDRGGTTFRPFGPSGSAFRLTQAQAGPARAIYWGILIAVFGFAVANLFHRNAVITLVAALVLLVAFFGWIAVARKGWEQVS